MDRGHDWGHRVAWLEFPMGALEIRGPTESTTLLDTEAPCILVAHAFHPDHLYKVSQEKMTMGRALERVTTLLEGARGEKYWGLTTELDVVAYTVN